jgi:TRAP-type C4-dicarboxylate transport system permease small subunit
MQTTLDRLIAALAHRLEAAIGIMLALMVVLVFGNVVLRYGFNSGITISEEVSRYLFIWLTFIGAIIAVHERAHLGVDTLPRLLPRKGRLACVIASELLMLFATALLFYGSWKQTVVNLSTKSPVSGTPLSLIYVAGLVASLMMGALFARNLYKLLVVGASDEDLSLSVESEDLAGVERATQALMVHRDGKRTEDRR